MKIFEKVTEKNFYDDGYLRANPDCRDGLSKNKFNSAVEHFLSVKDKETRYQYIKSDISQIVTTEILLKGSCDVDLLSLIDKPTEPLSKYLGDDYSNIWAPIEFIDMDKIGISRQFLEDSDIYHSKYFNIEQTKHALSRALDVCSTWVKFVDPTVLDLGSGSGNLTFACCELFDECSVLSTDLSHELLRILTDIKKIRYPNSNIQAVAMDALDARFKSGSFDIFMGSAILHHLIDADSVFEIAYHSLKKNGCAIFMEPMLSGHVVMTSLLRTLIYINDSMIKKYNQPKIKKNIIDFFHRLIKDYSVRGNVPIKMDFVKIDDLDDKRLFTKQGIEAAAKQAGFTEIGFANSYDSSVRFQNQLSSLLSYIEENYRNLPEWTKEIVNIFNESDISSEQNDIMLSAIIVCKK